MKNFCLVILLLILVTTAKSNPTFGAENRPEVLMLSYNYTLTGIVRDTNGEVVENMAVIVDGMATGVTTDAEGTFSITIDSDAKILVVDRPGYIASSVKLEELRAINNKSEIKLLIAVEAPLKVPSLVFD